MIAESYTHSSLATARRCLTEYDFKYNMRLVREGEESNEALDVGHAWAKAHEEFGRAMIETGQDPQSSALHAYASIEVHAPSEIWKEKLRRLFAAYHWFWKEQPFEIVEPEAAFRVEFEGRIYEGKRDAIIRLPDGRLGLHEMKTSSDSVQDESSYWDRLRMDVQVGLYSLTMPEPPAFILYDVTRKPTIRPKSIVKADAARMEAELKKAGRAAYFGETFTEEQLRPALAEAQESPALYGARLTADIGNEPTSYFARRNVPRIARDYVTLKENLRQQVEVIEHAMDRNLMHRNPDQCTAFGRLCEFFQLCSNNVRPQRTDTAIPKGYARREALHPELETPKAH